MFTGEANILSLPQFPLVIEYGILPPIVVTKIGDGIDMRWANRADPDVLHHLLQTRNWNMHKAMEEFEVLEKDTVDALKGAILADICGDPHRSQHLRRKARNLQIAKPPAFLAGFEDNSPQINKAYFDLLIGLDNELIDLKRLKLLRDVNSDRRKVLDKVYQEKQVRFKGIIQGVVGRIIPHEMCFEPLVQFFRRVDPKMMGCDSCFDPLNIVPHEWRVSAKIINYLHMEMLFLHWVHASIVPREQPSPPQFFYGTAEFHDLPRLQYDINSSEWKLLPSYLAKSGPILDSISRKRPRDTGSSINSQLRFLY